MRIAVTGAGGGLGRAFIERAPSRHEVIPFTHDDLPVEDRHAVMRGLVPPGPDIVVHAAAMTSVDGCEERPEAAFRVNALGTRNVAIAAREAGAILVAVSTDYVFDGEKGEPYHEFDEPRPLSTYGRSKLAGEREARLAPEHLIVRTSWVYGAGDDFVSTAIRQLSAGEQVGAIVDLHGTPTYVVHLAERILPAVLAGLRGIVHLGGPDRMTYHELLSRAKMAGDLPGELVEQKAGDLGRPAPRPADSSLTSLVLEGSGVPPMPPALEAIRELLEA